MQDNKKMRLVDGGQLYNTKKIVSLQNCAQAPPKRAVFWGLSKIHSTGHYKPIKYKQKTHSPAKKEPAGQKDEGDSIRAGVNKRVRSNRRTQLQPNKHTIRHSFL